MDMNLYYIQIKNVKLVIYFIASTILLSIVPVVKVWVPSFFTQLKASGNTVISKVMVVQTGQLIFYNTLVQDPVGVFYTIQKWNLHNFKNSLHRFLLYFLLAAKHAFNCVKMVVQTGKVVLTSFWLVPGERWDSLSQWNRSNVWRI